MPVRDKAWLLAASALVAAAVLLSYLPALSAGFVWDDRPLIEENPTLTQPERLLQVFGSGFWDTGEKNDRFRNFYRPFVTLSYAADRALWGERPLGFHLTNLLLHFGCALLVLALALQSGLRRRSATVAALLFAVHPVHVESVAWISGRTDLLCALFAFGALALARGGGLERPARRYGSASLVLCALLAKEMAITLPALIALSYLCETGRRWRWRRALALTLPHWLAAVLYLALRAPAVGVAPASLLPLSATGFAATALFVLARYLMLLLWPAGLDAHYPYGPVGALFSAPALLGGVLLAVAALAAARLTRRRPEAGYWALFAGITFLPVLGFGSFGDVLMADRFAYIPSLGAALLAGFLADAWWRAGSAPARRAAAVASLALVVAGGIASASRSRVWQDDLTLFSDMVRTSPDSALVRANLGLAWFRRGDYAAAARELRAAVELVPDYAIAHNNLGAVYERQGDLPRALVHYQRALAIAPDQLETRTNVGSLLVRLGEEERGLAILRGVVRRHPSFEPGLCALAEALEETGDERTALALIARAERLEPDDPQLHYLRGKILFEQGDVTGAAAAMRRFLALWPADDVHRKAAETVLLAAGAPAPARPTAD